MTAQKLTASTSTDAHKAFRQALQLKSNSEQPFSRETTGPMPIPQQQQAAGAIQDERSQAWGVGNSVEPDPRDQQEQKQQQQQQVTKRHQHLTVVTDTDTDADTTMPPASGAEAEADAAGGGGGGGSGAAIPMSPPSSPTHVVAAHSQDQLVVTTPAADSTTKPMGVDLPPVVAPSPTSTAALQEATAAAAAAQLAPAPVVPIRLGRGRKLCPNCKALTKSAVKQCRACNHIFNPVSQRMRAQLREPKENEEVPMLPRRRHRPSQRLLESLVEPENPGSATAAGEGGAPSAPTRRPLGSASNSAGGGGNQRVVSTPPASGAFKEQHQAPKRSHKRKNPLPPGVAPPKRKKGAAAAARLAAGAAAQSTSAADRDLAAGGGAGASTATARGILPILTLPEQQRVAQDLLASPAPSRHTVPESPELAPMASPAGPLLFMASSVALNLASSPLEDDSGWLSRSGSVGGGGGGASVGVGGVGNVSPTTAFVEQQLQLQQQQQQQQQQLFAAARAANSLPGLLLDDDDDDEDESPVRRQDGGIGPDLSAGGQEKDPFADVEMWWEGGGVAAVVDPTATVTAGVPHAFPMVGRDGAMQQLAQRVAFPHTSTSTSSNNNNTELLGDAEDALLWNPLRPSSSGETGAVNTAGGPTALTGTGAAGTPAAAAAGRTLTLWPGSSNNDNHLLMSASSSPSSSSSSALRGGGNHRSPPPSTEDVAYPNFERGAAIASAVGALPPSTTPTAASSTLTHGQGRAEYLLAEASCSSLPEPLVFAGNGTAVAAVSADSCVDGGGDGDGDGAEAGGFWNPLFPSTGGLSTSG